MSRQKRKQHRIAQEGQRRPLCGSDQRALAWRVQSAQRQWGKGWRRKKVKAVGFGGWYDCVYAKPTTTYTWIIKISRRLFLFKVVSDHCISSFQNKKVWHEYLKTIIVLKMIRYGVRINPTKDVSESMEKNKILKIRKNSRWKDVTKLTGH